QSELEYDFLLAPGADAQAIALRFDGASAHELDGAGNLVLHTAAGDVVQHAPVLYQVRDGGRVSVAGGYELHDDGPVGFQVGAYDASRPLVIDPTLLYSTYFGYSDNDSGGAIAVDGAGNAYVTGTVTPAAANGTPHVLLAKYSPSGARLFSIY